jgi:hypothetical protein
MNTVTMNGKLNLLDDMAQVLAAPRTKVSPTLRTPPPQWGVRVRPGPVYRPASRTATQPLWRTSLEVARETVAERLLMGTLFLSAAAALAWLGFTTLQFLFAWSHLVTWVRSAML